MSQKLTLALALLLASHTLPRGAEMDGVEWQPLSAQIRRVIEALNYQGAPISPADEERLRALLDQKSDDAAVKAQTILDPYCLFIVQINPESRVKVAQGPAKPQLVEQGWRAFLVKVENQAGVTHELRAVSPNAQSEFSGGGYRNLSDRQFKDQPQGKLPNEDRWMDMQMFNNQPL